MQWVRAIAISAARRVAAARSPRALLQNNIQNVCEQEGFFARPTAGRGWRSAIACHRTKKALLNNSTEPRVGFVIASGRL